jgi:hypothetical protein
MSAPEPAVSETPQGWTKAKAVREVDPIVISDIPIYPGQSWTFYVARQTKQDEDKAKSAKVISGKGESNVEWLARMTTRIPEGFADFPPVLAYKPGELVSPKDLPLLTTSVKHYFDDPNWLEGADFAAWVNLRWAAMISPPISFFRPE